MISIYDYADIMKFDLVLTRLPGQNGRWMAKFDKVHLKEGSCIASAYGNSNDKDEAIMDYCSQISGKKISYEQWSHYDDKFVRMVTDVPQLTAY